MKNCRGFSGLLVLSCVSLLTTFTSTASAVTVSLQSSADAFVDSAVPDKNFGGGGNLGIAASGMSKGEFQALMRFDLAAAKTQFNTTYGAGNWSVQSITLQLTSGAANNVLFNANAAGTFSINWIQNDTWIEGTGTPMAQTTDGVTWNSLPSFLSGSDQSLGSFSYDGSSASTATRTLATSSGLVADVLAGGLASFRFFTTDPAMSGVFNSRSFNTAASRPVLNVTAVPEPATWLLGVLGLIGLVVFRRQWSKCK